MSAGFTPGPWRTGIDGNNRVYGPDCTGEHTGLIAVVYKGRANMDLIAAAPDLYEALEEAADQLALLAKDPGGNPWVKQCRAALAKARGEQVQA